MRETNVAVLVGSLAKSSLNARLALAIEKAAPPGARFTQASIGDLPHYTPDDDHEPAPPVLRLRQQVRDADCVLVVSPEYNRSIPGVLKNALDHGSRPYGRSVWSGKPAAVIGVSLGATGTACMQQHLRAVLTYLDMPTMAQPEAYLQWENGLIDDAGNVKDEATAAFVSAWVTQFLAFAGANVRSRN